MMQLLVEDGLGHSKEPYVQIILEEPEFHSDGTRIVYDALHWALMHGIYRLVIVIQYLQVLHRQSFIIQRVSNPLLTSS